MTIIILLHILRYVISKRTSAFDQNSTTQNLYTHEFPCRRLVNQSVKTSL